MSFLKTPFNPRDVANLALWLDGADLSTISQDPNGFVTAISAPTDISGCLAWYDANDLTTLKQNTNGTTDVTLAGNKIGYWADKSGNGYHMVASNNASRPELHLRVDNNKTIRSVYSDYFVAQTTQAKWLRNSTTPATAAQSWFIVHGEFGEVTNGRVAGRTTNSAVYVSGQSVSPSTQYFATAAGSINNVNLATNTKTGRFLSSLVFANAGSVSTYGNGLLTATFDPDDLYSTTNGFGVLNDSGGTPGSGKIYEVILYNRAVTDEERRRIEKYLSAKWGVSCADSAYPGSVVGYWADKSGNNRHVTQSTAVNKPLIAPHQLGGHTISLDGSNDALFTTGGQTLKTGMTVCAAYFSGNVNFSSLFAVGDNAAGKRWLCGSGSTQVGIDFFTGAAYTGVSAQNRTGITTWAVNPISNNVKIRLNGAQIVNVTPSPVLSAYTSDVIAIGTVPLANEQFLVGRVFELLVFSRVLADAECLQLERYLANKWKIALA
jgi:hypothetical protein